MKQPKLSDLKPDRAETRRMRAAMARTKKIKITINLDADLLDEIRKVSSRQGAPYQTYLNFLLRETLSQKKSEESRIDHLEKEILEIKKSLAA